MRSNLICKACGRLSARYVFTRETQSRFGGHLLACSLGCAEIIAAEIERKQEEAEWSLGQVV
jgi:hypothetical protein